VGEGSHIAVQVEVSPIPIVVEEEVDLAPDIEISGDTQVRLSLNAEGCIVCKKILEDLPKDDGFLRGSKEVTMLGKISHLYAEFDIEIPVECPECLEKVGLRKWSEDFRHCGFCGTRIKKEGMRGPVDDKEWASV